MRNFTEGLTQEDFEKALIQFATQAREGTLAWIERYVKSRDESYENAINVYCELNGITLTKQEGEESL